MPRQRSSWRKSTSGCTQCKASHVKCDEQRPCHRCTRLGRECVYERQVIPRPKNKALHFQFDLFQLPSRFALPAFSGSERDLSAFQFFLEETVPILEASFSVHHWAEVLLSVQSSDSALHHACLAVGSLHKSLLALPDSDSGTPGSSSSSAGSSVLATRHEDVADASWLYIQALRKSRQAIATGNVQPIHLKLTSILLALFSSLNGRVDETRAHLFGGLVLVDLDVASITDLDQRKTDGVLASYRFLSLIASGAMNIESDRPPEVDLFMRPRAPATNVRDARGDLHALLRLSMLFTHHERKGSFASIIEQERARAELQLAFYKWKETINDLAFHASEQDRLGIVLLEAQYEFARSRLDVHDTPDGPRSGASLASLRFIVETIERFLDLYYQSSNPGLHVFSFQTGMIPMLLSAARQSHDADLQRTILALLQRVPEAEGTWTASKAADAVQRMLAGDETGGMTYPGWSIDNLC